MDNFVEQMIAKKPESGDILKRFAILFGGILLSFLSLFAAMFFPMLLLFTAGFVYLTWFFIQGTYVEYEYIITNNDMDVDKILGKKRRKRLITIKLDKAVEWGEYQDGRELDALVTVQAHDCSYEGLWYITVNHDKHGKTALLFSPNRGVLQAMNKSIPYSLRIRDLKDGLV